MCQACMPAIETTQVSYEATAMRQAGVGFQNESKAGIIHRTLRE